jgi:hypothetical protein
MRMNPDSISPAPVAVPALHQLTRILVPVGIATLCADILFWDTLPGANVGILLVILAALVALCRREKLSVLSWGILGLLLLTAVQSVIELSFSTVAVGAVLLLALAGNTFQSHLPTLWSRFSEAAYGLLTAAPRWLLVGHFAAREFGAIRSGTAEVSNRAGFALRVFLPTAVLLAIFTAFFAAGNAAFSDLVLRTSSAAFSVWALLDLTPLRFAWWALCATLALGIFHRVAAPDAPRWWALEIPRISRDDTRLAAWQTGFALVVLNGLFFVVNTLDAIFLWQGAALPEGVSYSAYLHAGVNSLIAAVLLSAVVIAGMFQQQEAITSKRWLKRFALFWVAQNLLLIAGVLRRLLLYAETYHLTEKRVYVGCFLLLVTTGFVLLAWFVHRQRTLNWLLGMNVIATFVLFFTLQFVDVAGYVARHNVSRAAKTGILDIDYLGQLGPNAWPALMEVATGSADPALRRQAEETLRDAYSTRIRHQWQSYQWRLEQRRQALATYLSSTR